MSSLETSGRKPMRNTNAVTDNKIVSNTVRNIVSNTESNAVPRAGRAVEGRATVLFLAANPMNTSRLGLDEEMRDIEAKIRASQYRDALALVSAWAVRADDLLQVLNTHRPEVVHFSGHGTAEGELIVVNELRRAQPVSARALRHLFRALKDNIRLVVLNACFSRVQAEAIVKEIDCAIGMNTAVGDEAAIRFAASFYRAIGFGRSVGDAFQQGIASLLLEDIPEEGTPVLLAREGVDPYTVYLTGEQAALSIRAADGRRGPPLAPDYRSAYERMLKALPPEGTVHGNAAKYRSYREAWARVRAAQRDGYFFEAITLLESIMSDRIISHLMLVRGPGWQELKRRHLPFAQLIQHWGSTAGGPIQAGPYANLVQAVDQWRTRRNRLAHGMAKPPAGAPPAYVEQFVAEAQSAAQEGEVLARLLANWCRQAKRRALLKGSGEGPQPACKPPPAGGKHAHAKGKKR